MQKTKKELIIVLSDTNWDEQFWVSRHYITNELSKIVSGKVIFIEKSPTILSPFFHKDASFKSLLSKSPIKVSHSLTIYKPKLRLPFDRSIKFISAINQLKITLEIKELLMSNPAENIYFISFDYKSGSIFKKLQNNIKKIYYVVDEVSEFNWKLSNKKTILSDERLTISNANLVVYTAPKLLEKVTRHSKNNYFLSHGIDFEKYINLPLNNPPKSKFMIGFLGKIEHWVDIELLNKIAIFFSEQGTLVIMGSKNEAIDKMIHLHNNVEYWGVIKREDIPHKLAKLSVGIIPFKINKLVNNVNPLKLYEYLGAGLPVVSTTMPSVQNLKALDVFEAKTHSLFISCLDQVNRNELVSSRKERHNYMKQFSWQNKAYFLLNKIRSI